MKSRKSESSAGKASVLTGTTITADQEYTLKKPLINRGKELEPGQKVKLNSRQAKWLKGSEHI